MGLKLNLAAHHNVFRSDLLELKPNSIQFNFFISIKKHTKYNVKNLTTKLNRGTDWKASKAC